MGFLEIILARGGVDALEVYSDRDYIDEDESAIGAVESDEEGGLDVVVAHDSDVDQERQVEQLGQPGRHRLVFEESLK